MPVQEKELTFTPVLESQVPFYTGSMQTLVIHCSQHNYQEPIDSNRSAKSKYTLLVLTVSEM